MADELEDRVMRKVAFRIVPFIMLLYFVAYIDRVNIGFAALTMNQDLGFSPVVFGLGAGIFFWGYFLFEVPSNIILDKVGARLWIARVMITWGIVSAAMTFVWDATSFYVLRFLLGAARGGLLSRHHPVPQLLVPGASACGDYLAVHGGSTNFGRARIAALECAP